MKRTLNLPVRAFLVIAIAATSNLSDDSRLSGRDPAATRRAIPMVTARLIASLLTTGSNVRSGSKLSFK